MTENEKMQQVNKLITLLDLYVAFTEQREDAPFAYPTGDLLTTLASVHNTIREELLDAILPDNARKIVGKPFSVIKGGRSTEPAPQ